MRAVVYAFIASTPLSTDRLDLGHSSLSDPTAPRQRKEQKKKMGSIGSQA
jgi:hypothetical protein